MNRALAQKSANVDMNDPDWQEHNPDEARKIVNEHKEWLNEFAQGIETRRGQDANIGYIRGWVEAKAKAGKRIIVIDPITMLDKEGQAEWVADKDLIMGIKASAEKYRCSIILVTHPIKHCPVAKDKHVIPDMAHVMGGAIIRNASACVLWLRNEDKGEFDLKLPSDMGTTTDLAEIDKSLHILKTRDGKAWQRIGMSFENLNFIEKGVMK